MRGFLGNSIFVVFIGSIWLGTCLPASDVHAQVAPTNPSATRRTPVADVFQRWKDSVVFVTGPIFKIRNPSLEEFFKVTSEIPVENSVGSGFVLHESGYVITNAHAAEKVIYSQVALSDGRVYQAESIASVHEQDVALLKIDAGRPLVPVRLARGGDLLIGEPVIVIAHPHGLRHTCTAGILSATGRTSDIADIKNLTLRNLIQTDAGINPGSSGGPWFNILGEVIGLTASKKQDADDIGFAITADTIRRLLPDMLDVHRRYGLISGLTVAPDGVCRVAAVAPKSPGQRATVRAGDVITSLGGRPTPTALDFHLALVGRKPGETLDVALDRRGQAIRTSLVLGRRPKPDALALLRQKLGLTAVPLPAEKSRALGLYVPHGVLLMAVDPSRYASVEHKPASGDILARVNKIRPRDMDHLGLILEQIAPGQSVSMVILRQRNAVNMRIDIRLAIPK